MHTMNFHNDNINVTWCGAIKSLHIWKLLLVWTAIQSIVIVNHVSNELAIISSNHTMCAKQNWRLTCWHTQNNNSMLSNVQRVHYATMMQSSFQLAKLGTRSLEGRLWLSCSWDCICNFPGNYRSENCSLNMLVALERPFLYINKCIR